jgi:hypothetical protein
MSLASSSLLRRIAHGLAFAMLLATLAPAVSRTLASWRAPGQGDWVEVCSSQGMQWVQVDAGAVGNQGDVPSQDPEAMDLCGHCTLAAERFAPLIPTMPVVATEAGHWPHPLFVARVWASRAAPSPSARGPPLLT